MTTNHLNDDILGRTLDAIASLVQPTSSARSLPSASSPANTVRIAFHVDTTTFSVSGEYDADFASRGMTITYSHPKDGRWDLKQFVLGMATDQHGIPLFLQTLTWTPERLLRNGRNSAGSF